MPTLDPLATFPRRVTPSLISASAETSRLLRAGATVPMESKSITAKKTIFLIDSLISPRYNTCNGSVRTLYIGPVYMHKSCAPQSNWLASSCHAWRKTILANSKRKVYWLCSPAMGCCLTNLIGGGRGWGGRLNFLLRLTICKIMLT